MEFLAIDSFINILSMLTAADLINLLVVSRKINQMINTEHVFKSLLKENMRIFMTDTTNNLRKQYLIKLSIVDQISLTLIDFDKIISNSSIEWAVTGGMCLRLHNIKRPTYDLDIIIFDYKYEYGDSKYKQVDQILNSNKWEQCGDPLENQNGAYQYGLQYSDSWIHPIYKIKIDIMYADPYQFISKGFIKHNNIKYLNIKKILNMKISSIFQRTNDKSGSDKDLTDVINILDKIYDTENDKCNILIKKIKHVELSHTINNYNLLINILKDLAGITSIIYSDLDNDLYDHPHTKKYLIYHNVNPTIIADITLYETPPNNYATWDSWLKYYEDIYIRAK